MKVSQTDFSLEQQTCFRAKSIAHNYAVSIELSSGWQQVKDFGEFLVETTTAVTPASVFKPSVNKYSDKGYSVISCKYNCL